MANLYTASKTKSNRPGWSVSFRHPLRHDSKGKPGLKMRRGLGTTIEQDADRMVAEMNEILSNPSWWSALKRDEAEKLFSEAVVNAFYDEIQAGRDDPEKIREQHIALPTAQDGYSRVFLVGTTGAGKTSLLRQVIGSDPDEDRFPSTAPAKTTIADIEVIQADGPYEAVVTFFSEFQIQANTEECVTDACMATVEGAADEKIAERFLNHRDQKFRLSYILGPWSQEDVNVDEFSFDSEEEAQIGNDEGIDDRDREKNLEALKNFVRRVKQLSASAVAELSVKLGEDMAKLSGGDRDAFEELLEPELTGRSEFDELVQDVLDHVRTRFELVSTVGGELHARRSGWPEFWVTTTEDRTEFVRRIRWFSSNYWPHFGRLLTPLVQGIRVRGPLYPKFAEDLKPKLALIDGQGLGHTPDSSSSVTTHVTRRFSDVDVILLVDNAGQPMQAAPMSVLRAVAATGHEGKLAIAFTHFDQIKGKSLPTFADKRSHVMASVTNALTGLKDILGAPVVKSIERHIDARCFMLGGVDKLVAKLPPKAADYMRNQLRDMLTLCERAILPPPLPEASPIYDPTGLAFVVQEAVTKFLGPWLARLGLSSHNGVHKEHWTRIKALNRRIAGELDVEYDNLRPVADLMARLTEAISKFLDNPIEWTRPPADEQEAQTAISQVKRTVSAALHELAVSRLIAEHLEDWRIAYEYRGSGSAYKRSLSIRQIYEIAAPLPRSDMTKPSSEFMATIRGIVQVAIEDAGGKVKLADAA